MEGVELKQIWVNKVKCQHISKLGTLLKKTFTWLLAQEQRGIESSRGPGSTVVFRPA